MKTLLYIASLILSVALLIPSVSYAGNYCVTMPTQGNKWNTKRDNTIQYRFKYAYKISNSKGDLKGEYSTDGIGGYDVDYASDNYTGNKVCLNKQLIQQGLEYFVLTADKETNGFSFPSDSVASITAVWMDIKWGGDCARAGLAGTQNYEIHRRGHNHVDPFGCHSK